MADGNGSGTKVCSKCGVEQGLGQFRKIYRTVSARHDGLTTSCNACRRKTRNAWYAANPDARRKQVESNKRRSTLEKRRRARQRQRARWVANGLTTNGTPRQRPAGRKRPEKDGYETLTVNNAQQAWAWWVRVKAPAWWVREAYRDKPWNNPRISASDKWRIRYWCDPGFRAKQIEKVQRTKSKRRAQIDATDDGTLTGQVIVSLFAAAKVCSYCGRTMRSVEKSLDHVTPLDRGGAHSISNVVVACKPCNFSKHTSTLKEWRARQALAA